MELSKLSELDQLAREEGRRYPKRRNPYYDQILNDVGKHFLGIVGPRGAGKTVLLKQIALQIKDSFYLSVDTLTDENLFETAKSLIERYKIKCLLLDEIHFQQNFKKDLKKIFDFLNVQIIFTSSVALAMVESSYDLSRRVELLNLYPFSFREYLFFTKDVVLPQLTIQDILEKKWTNEHMRYSYAFENYLKGGIYPFALEEPDVLPLLENILQKIINKDIPLVARLHVDELGAIEKMLQFIGRSPVDGINYSSVSKNIGVTKYKSEQYIGLLRKTFVLNPIFPAGTNVLKEPKVLMCLPYRLIYRPYNESIGELREDFFAETLTMCNLKFYYLKSTRGTKTPDFLIKENGDEIAVEVGGKGKGREQFKGISVQKKIRFSHAEDVEGNKRPLFLVGYIA